MSTTETRTERDSLGTLEVPVDALFGAQTQRAVQNFPISDLSMPRPFLRALGLIKRAAAEVNRDLGGLDTTLAEAIARAAQRVADGELDSQFPVDVFQTGSGTSSNMNANEVIAALATRELGNTVHPNDHVNMGQSSNDVIPTAIHLGAALQVAEALVPALTHLADTIDTRRQELGGITKTGRTHLMDAMPLRFDQELGGWAAQVRAGRARVEAVIPRLHLLALGGTAVGTGINAHPEFAGRVAARLSALTGLELTPSPCFFESLSSQDTAVELSGQLRVIAVSLMKIANDLRWMNSGPLAGLGEIELPALQPGSSIMPGKVNPVVPEAVAMVAAQVIGNDATVTVAGQSGNFQLNVMLPVVAYNVMQSLQLLTNASRVLADKAVAGFQVREEQVRAPLERNPILVTALNPVVGYQKAAEIAKRAYREGRPVLDVALEETEIPRDQLSRLLNPQTLTQGGIQEQE